MDININCNNYDNWVVDYFDGQLTPNEMEAMNQFFEENPELLKDVIDINNFTIEPEVLKHPNKKSLLKRAFVVDRKTLLPFISSAAAVVAFLATLFFIGQNDAITNNNQDLLSAGVSSEHPSIKVTIPGGMANSQIQVQYQSKNTRDEVLPIYKVDGEMKDAKITVVSPVVNPNDEKYVPVQQVTNEAILDKEYTTEQLPIINQNLAQEVEQPVGKTNSADKIKQIEEDGFAVETDWASNEEAPITLDQDSAATPSLINALDQIDVEDTDKSKIENIFELNKTDKPIKELPKKDNK